MNRNVVFVSLLVAFWATTIQAGDDLKSIRGYGKTTWGMTPDEVLKAEAPGAEKVEKPGTFGDLIGHVALHGVRIGSSEFNVEFYFDPDKGLQHVSVTSIEDQDAKANAVTFAFLEKLFTKEFGPPTRKEGAESPRVLWEMPNTSIRLLHFNMLGTSLVKVSYMPAKTGNTSKKGYALSEDNPVMLGSPEGRSTPKTLFAYMDRLRGPNGEKVTYHRIGTCCEFKTQRALFGTTGILEVWEVTYGGVAKPMRLYINVYDQGEVLAPEGLVLGD